MQFFPTPSLMTDTLRRTVLIMVWVILALLTGLGPRAAFAATSIPFTITMSESMTVTGTPRIAVNVGGATRYATYTSGSGTSTLVFTYTMTAGDIDLDGVTLSSPIDLNGGTLKDLNGNNAALTFTVPNTANVKVNYPSLAMDFTFDADGRYNVDGTTYNDLTSFLTATGGTFTRASTATYFDSTGTLQTATSGTPRFDHDPANANARKGLLIEEGRTNLFLRSAQFDTAGWLKTGSTVVADATTAPDGTLSADKLIGNNAVTGRKATYQAVNVTSGQKYTFSVYLKKAEFTTATIWFDETYVTEGAYYGAGVSINLNTGTAATSAVKVTAVGNNWYRCTVSATPSSTATMRFTISIGNPNGGDYTGNGTSGIYLWGGQVEQGAFTTSYIPTTTAAASRSADVLSIPTGSWFTANEWSSVTEATATIPQSTWIPLMVENASYGSKYSLLTSGGAATTGKNAANTGTGNSATSQTLFKAGASFSNTQNVLAVLNGGTVGTGGALSTNTATSMCFGCGQGSYMNGNLRLSKYYPAYIAPTQLQLLTQ